MEKNAMILHSSGLDSTVCLLKARSDGRAATSLGIGATSQLRLRVSVVVIIVSLMIAGPLAAGNFDLPLFASGPQGPPPPHPVCGVERWLDARDAVSGEPLRFPVFKRCRHLLAFQGTDAAFPPEPAKLAFLEVVALVFFKALGPRGGFISSPAGLVNLGVPPRRWVPAGCEMVLAQGYSLSDQAIPPPMPGDPLAPNGGRPAGWTLCQNLAIASLANHYKEDTDVIAIDKLSRTLDALDLSKPESLDRLARLRLALTTWLPTATVAELQALAEGAQHLPPRPVPHVFVAGPPFVLSSRSRSGLRLEAHGTARGNTISITQGKLTLESPKPNNGPYQIIAGFCFLLPGTSEWRVQATSIVSFRSPLDYRIDLQPGVARDIQHVFSTLLPNVWLNLPRYWICIQVRDGVGNDVFFHADDAVEKGCPPAACAG